MCVCLFKLHARVLGPSWQNWRLCSIRGRLWDCSQHCYGSYWEQCLPVQSRSRIETDVKNEPIWSQTSWIPRQNDFTRWDFTASSEKSKLLGKLRFLKKALRHRLRFAKYDKEDILKMAENIHQFYRLLEAKPTIITTSDPKETFDSVKEAVRDAYELALR